MRWASCCPKGIDEAAELHYVLGAADVGAGPPPRGTAEAQVYTRELPNAELHVIGAGRFAPDEKADDVAV
jgi:hypothetical protein